MKFHFEELRRLLIGIAAIILSLSFISNSQAKNLTKVTLQLKWFHQFQFAGYYAAIEKGFYRDSSLDVILKEGRPGINNTDELIAGRADFGIDMPVILIERNKGKPIIVLAAILQHSPEVLIARKDSEISSVHDLINKRILIRPKGHAEIRAMIKSEGISENQLKMIDHTWDINDLVERRVDVSGAYITDFPFLMQERGIPYSIISPLTYGIDFYGDCLFTTEKKNKKNPALVKAFLDASLKGWEYAMAHQEEIIDLILKKYSTRFSREALRYEGSIMQELMQPKFIEIGHMNPGRWKHIADTFVKLDMLKTDYSLDGFLYNPDHQQNYAGMTRIIRIISAIAIAIGVITIILLFFNRRLNRNVIERTEHLSAEISERKKVENALAKSEERLRLALDSVSDAVWDWNVGSNEVYFSPGWYTMLGYEPYELPQEFETWKHLLHPDDMTESEQIILAHLESDKTFKIEFRMKAKDDQWKWILGRGRTVSRDDQGKPLRMIGTHFDLTDRKQAEEEIRQAHKLESIGTLAGGIAHEFNNILGIIVGNAELALNDLPEWNPSFSNIMEIKTASLRAKDVVRQLLSFSRKTEQKQVILDIKEVVKESISLIRASIPTSIEIHQSFPDKADKIIADATQIHQILINLCTNASHAMMDDGGLLEVILRPLTLKEKTNMQFKDVSPGKYLELIVKDSGSGIDSKIKEKIFDPYFTTKEVGKGTGMGLAVVHGIVKNHNGEIFVDSELGKGTTFTILFPITDDEQEDNITEITIDSIPHGKDTILFVDDEESLVDMAKMMLINLGYTVEGCTNPIDALSLFEKNPDRFDLVISDMTMPKMSGVKLSEQLRGLRPDVPIIICTGHSSQIDEEKAIEIGISAYAMKPVTMSEIAKLIRTVLDK